MFQRQAMRRTAVIGIVVVLVGLLLFVVRRAQVWIGHEKNPPELFKLRGPIFAPKGMPQRSGKVWRLLFLTIQVGRQCPMGRVQTDGASQQGNE